MGCGGSKLSLPSPIVSDGGEAEQAGENKRNDENGSWSTSEYVELNKLVKEASIDNEINELIASIPEDDPFCDEEFPAEDKSLFYTERPNHGIKWARPKDIVQEGKQPHLLVDGISSNDIKQGILGDCWFLSSCAAVSQQEKFMRKIVPDDQPLCGKNYKGIVHFHFWHYGRWVNIYVDDRLPVKDGELIYASCDDPTEFWVALVEKAYAKLHGCYEALEGGQTMDALVDLTGGLAERYEIKSADPNMYRHLLCAHRAGAFIACSRKGDWRQTAQTEDNGLVSGHAYTITNVLRISHRMGEERLLRIRNPWGNETEWKGSWSDEDSNWNWVDEETLKLMQVEKKDDGEFWMSFKDFCRHFQEVTICTTGPESSVDSHLGHVQCIEGIWIEGATAGGSRNDLERFATNPQYVLTLSDPDDFDPMTDDPENEGKCSVVIALMQIQRKDRCHAGSKNLQIGFILYQTEDPSKRLPAKHFKFNSDSGKSGIYINLREVSGRFELEPGHYVIIPSTFQPDKPGKFLLRVFAQKRFKLELIDS